MAPVIKTKTKKPDTKAVKIVKIIGLVVLFVFLGMLLLNSLLCIFADRYYPTWGRYCLFAIVSDSMEPAIKTGNMIASAVPKSPDDIKEGVVITYEYKQNNSTILITHRVIAVNVDSNTGKVLNYTTKGDNAAGVDSYRPVYDDIVGVFSDETKQCGFFGYFFGFLQSAEGTIALILTLMIAIIAYIVVRFINIVNTWRTIAVMALKKSGELLGDTENEDLVTIADVIGIIAKDPATRAEQRRKDKNSLGLFVRECFLSVRTPTIWSWTLQSSKGRKCTKSTTQSPPNNKTAIKPQSKRTSTQAYPRLPSSRMFYRIPILLPTIPLRLSLPARMCCPSTTS